MSMNGKTGQSNAFASALKHVCDELLKLNEVEFYGSQIKIVKAKSTRGQTIAVSSSAEDQPVVVNKNLEKQKSLQKPTFSSRKRKLL